MSRNKTKKEIAVTPIDFNGKYKDNVCSTPNKDPLTSKNNLEKTIPSPMPASIEGIPINMFSKKIN